MADPKVPAPSRRHAIGGATNTRVRSQAVATRAIRTANDGKENGEGIWAARLGRPADVKPRGAGSVEALRDGHPRRARRSASWWPFRVEIAQRSVIEVERMLDTVRESYPARRSAAFLATVTCSGRRLPRSQRAGAGARPGASLPGPRAGPCRRLACRARRPASDRSDRQLRRARLPGDDAVAGRRLHDPSCRFVAIRCPAVAPRRDFLSTDWNRSRSFRSLLARSDRNDAYRRTSRRIDGASAIAPPGNLLQLALLQSNRPWGA